MILYVDTDIIIKLSVHGLLNELAPAFECKFNDIHTLHSAPYVLESNKKIKADYPGPALLKAYAFVKKTQTIPAPPPAIADRLETVENIDAGEVILYGAGFRDRQALLLTNDKNSIRALNFASDCENISARLSGRVYPISLVILRMIDKLGLERIQKKAIKDPSGEKYVNDAFFKRKNPTRALVENELKADLVKLRSKSGGLLGAF